MNIIQLNEVVKMYDSKAAMNKLSFEVQQGEIFGLLGPSGSGKTTTIKMITGETAVTSGEIKALNHSGQALQTTNYRKQIGILSDNSALYERLSVADNLKMFAKIYDSSTAEVDRVLQFVGLENEKNKVVKKLSKGMKQRILLAKAMIHQPHLLFLDEPTSALDPQTTKHIHQGLLQLKQQGVTIFLTTHNMEEAEHLCDRIALINNGKLIALDTPDQLKQQYADQTVEVELHKGQTIYINQDAEGAEQLKQMIIAQEIKRMRTNEPTLGEIFIQLTGKELV